MLAERGGFEPPGRRKSAQGFSRPPLSTGLSHLSVYRVTSHVLKKRTQQPVRFRGHEPWDDLRLMIEPNIRK